MKIGPSAWRSQVVAAYEVAHRQPAQDRGEVSANELIDDAVATATSLSIPIAISAPESPTVETAAPAPAIGIMNPRALTPMLSESSVQVEAVPPPALRQATGTGSRGSLFGYCGCSVLEVGRLVANGAAPDNRLSGASEISAGHLVGRLHSRTAVRRYRVPSERASEPADCGYERGGGGA